MATTKQIDARLTKGKRGYKAKVKDVHGKTHNLKVGATRLDEARKIIDQSRVLEIESMAKAGILTAEALTVIMAGRNVTCETALAEWESWITRQSEPNTVRSKKLYLMRWINDLGGMKWPVNRITFDHIDRFVNPPDDDVKKNTREMRLASVRSFFDFITARAYFVGNPSKLCRVRIKDLPHEQKETKEKLPFTAAEVKHVLAHTEGFWKWATALSYWAGLRLGDVATLEWASILPDEIIVWTRKSGSRVALPIDDPLIGGGVLRTIFMEMMENNHHPQFCFPDQRAIATDPNRRANLSVYYMRVLERLGIEGKSFHSLRHAFGDRLDKAGKTIEEIGRLLGHSPSSTEVTKVYTHSKKKPVKAV